MVASKTHAHIDSPSDAQLKRLVDGKPVALRRLYLETHQAERRTAIQRMLKAAAKLAR